MDREVKKFKYKLPIAKSFILPYPDPITLAPGTSITIPVRFEPLANEPVLDFIEVVTKVRPAWKAGGDVLHIFSYLQHQARVHTPGRRGNLQRLTSDALFLCSAFPPSPRRAWPRRAASRPCSRSR